MFTGIIEALATVRELHEEGSNIRFTLEVEFGDELKVDQSVAHNGVCLTVTRVNGKEYDVVAIAETLKRSDLSSWKPGSIVNVERCMPAHGRFDGHIVQGHVDTTGVCNSVESQDGSWLVHIEYEAKEYITVEKGSICVNGVSLTVVDSYEGGFSVALIPYTFEHTAFHRLKPGETVNLEFDILGKYIEKILRQRENG